MAREDYAWGPARHAQQGRADFDGIECVITPVDRVLIGAVLAGQAHAILGTGL